MTASTLIDLSGLQSESRNENSANIDKVDTLELCHIINQEDSQIAAAVHERLPVIAAAIDDLESRVRKGGKVVYVGAGTSGRLGVLDASELPPTYSANPDQFVALIAGGDAALRHAQEGAEDDVEKAVADLKALPLEGSRDALIGIAASGRTPYVLSCLKYAKSLGCVTVGVACSSPSAMSESRVVDHMIEAVTGGEVVTGSTRMKAGTATKLVLNMLSTGVMIRTGKTFGNMMVDLKATNLKLKQRARNILREICGPSCPPENDQLDKLLECCDGNVKLAIATISLKTSVAEAKQALADAGGVLAVALDSRNSSVNGAASAGSHEMQHSYVLCVDGGATKCAAVVVAENGEQNVGEAGGCNATEIGPKSATDMIMLATNRALAKFTNLHGKSVHDVTFSKIWIGLAGYDRPAIAGQMNGLLQDAFNKTIGRGLHVCNDIEMVATTAAQKAEVDTAVVLIAGTGSVAMTYTKSADGYSRTLRVGGYGHLLGDEGSAFDIGRAGIKHALEDVDNVSQGGLVASSRKDLTLLTNKMLDHFEVVPQSGIDFFNSVMSSTDPKSSNTEAKWKIANSARAVLEAARTSEAAADILKKAVESLAALAHRAVSVPLIDTKKSVLIMTGGLMRDDMFRDMVTTKVSRSSGEFKSVEVIAQPALTGALYLQNHNKRPVG